MQFCDLRVSDLMDMKNVLVCLFLLPFLTVEASETSDFTLSRIQVLPIKDTQPDRQYELYIKLPESSHQTAFAMTGVRSVTWLSNFTKEKR